MIFVGPFTADQWGIWNIWAHVRDEHAPTWGAVSPWDGTKFGWATVDTPDLEVLDPIPDTDGDGMSNAWETINGLNPNDGADALLDPDGDGFNNVAEHNLDTKHNVPDAGSATTGGTLPAQWPAQNAAITQAVGITSGELTVGPSGAASYSVPIWVTPGTAGLQPQLSLSYSSQGGAGVAGWGWSLTGLSSISRGPQSYAVDGANYVPGVNLALSDRFYMDGQRLINIEGSYGTHGAEYRTEIDSFTRVISYGTAGNGPQWFKAWTKAGLIIEFGNSTNSRLMAGSTVRTWAVSKISDTFGNYMTFEYSITNGEQLLERILYTGHEGGTAVAPYASVRFVYEDRPDKVEGYFKNFQYRSTKRIKEIRSYYREGTTEEKQLRTYKLAYIERPYSSRSLLTSIMEVGLNGVELLPLTFDYSASEYGWDSVGLASYNNASPNGPTQYLLADNNGSSPEPPGTGFVDLNGDGWTDFVFAKGSSKQSFLNTGTGWVSSTAYQLPWPLTKSDGLDGGGRFVDFDGDGLVDYVWHQGGSDKGARRNTGAGWEAAAAGWVPPARISKDTTQMRNGRFLDINGDGRQDFLAYYEPDGDPNGLPHGCLIRSR